MSEKLNLLIRNVRLVNPNDDGGNLRGNPHEETLPVVDVAVANGKIKEIGKSLPPIDGEIIDAKELYLFPGLIDLHTHFREPGFEAKETIHTGSMAALRGGFVASVSMPNTLPPCDQQSVIDNILRKAREVPYHIFPAGTISKGREGKELSEMADLKHAGIVAVSDDGNWVGDSLLMRRAMEYASMLNLIIMSHCEDKRLSADGVMNEGLTSTKLGLRGIPNACEDVAVARDIELAKLTGARLHICHVSTARSVELIQRAKSEGVSITAEVTPHHLALTEECVEGYDTNYKMNPPLRSQNDRRVMRQALREGVIDCISTDHAPHTDEDKMSEFDQAAFGTIGLETALAVVLTELYREDKCSLMDIAKWMALNPAKILNLGHEFGRISKGAVANLTLVDLEKEWVVTPQDFSSKSKNSCFLNQKLKGKVVLTICAGRLWRF